LPLDGVVARLAVERLAVDAEFIGSFFVLEEMDENEWVRRVMSTIQEL
jgi:hypothetical protein